MKLLLYWVLVAVVLAVPAVRRLFRELDPPRRIFLALLFLLVFAGQVNAKKYPTYPFVKWGMYNEGGSELRFFGYTGVRADGSEAPFPVAHLVRTHSTARALECATCGKRMLWRLRGLGRKRLWRPEGPERDAAVAEYEGILRAAWEVYQGRHPEADFERVRVYRNHLVVADYQGSDSIERTLLWEVDLP